ncbi:MAG: hypothetical protein ACI4A3_08505 [Lachnospiraceae bacterium]
MTRENDSVTRIILMVSIRTLVNIMLLFVLVEGFTQSYRFSYKVFGDMPYIPASSVTKTITIESGSSAKDVAAVLETNEIVEGEYLFLARLYLGKYNSRIVAGTYTLSPSMSPDEICRCICGIQSEDAS